MLNPPLDEMVLMNSLLLKHHPARNDDVLSIMLADMQEVLKYILNCFIQVLYA